MAHAASASPDSVRSTPPLGTPFPTFPAPSFEEDSQIKLRAPLRREGWYEEDPFPLVRERDSMGAIEITFDESFFTRDTAPRIEAVRVNSPLNNPSAIASPAVGPSADWRGIPEGSLAEEPAPPSTAFHDDANDDDVRAPRQRLSGRAIAARLVFGAIFCGIVALLGYEVRVLWQTGVLPF